MPNHVSCEKRIRQDKKRRDFNRYYKVMAKRAIAAALEAKDPAAAADLLSKASKVLDRISTKGIVPKNYASNQKSRMARHVLALKSA